MVGDYRITVGFLVSDLLSSGESERHRTPRQNIHPINMQLWSESNSCLTHSSSSSSWTSAWTCVFLEQNESKCVLSRCMWSDFSILNPRKFRTIAYYKLCKAGLDFILFLSTSFPYETSERITQQIHV